MSLAVYDFDDTDSSHEHFSDFSSIESSSSSTGSSCSELDVASTEIQNTPEKLDRLRERRYHFKISGNIGVFLWNREIQWSSHFTQGLTIADDGLRDGPLVQKSAVFRQVRLREIVQNATDMIAQGHVFLGFTQDGRYLLSYNTVEENAPEIVEVNGAFFAHQEGPYAIQYYLHFWNFRPFTEATTLYHSVRLFEGALCTDTFTGDNVNISVSQWLNDQSRLVVVGYWEDFSSSSSYDADSSSREAIQLAISIISIPDRSRQVASDIHTMPISSSHVSSCDCHPIFPPKICLIIPNLVVLKCDQAVLLYRLTDAGLLQETTSQPLPLFPLPTSRKRKYEDGEEDIESDERECHQLDPDSVMICKAFLGDGSSSLIYWWGEKRLLHPLQPVFRDVGAPLMAGENLVQVELGSILIDCVMVEAWRFLQRTSNFASMTRTYHDLCAVSSVSWESQEILLQASLFVAATKRPSRTNRQDKLQRHYSFPFFLRVNFVTGSCFFQCHKKALKKLAGDETEWNLCQKLKGLSKQSKGRNSKPFAKVHSMNNFGVNGGSATSLISPDGFVEITL